MKRVETGVVQFEDDWPGVFMRGDDCMFYAMHLERLLASLPAETIDFNDILTRKALQGLLATMKRAHMPVEEKDLQRIYRIGSDQHNPSYDESPTDPHHGGKIWQPDLTDPDNPEWTDADFKKTAPIETHSNVTTSNDDQTPIISKGVRGRAP